MSDHPHSQDRSSPEPSTPGNRQIAPRDEWLEFDHQTLLRLVAVADDTHIALTPLLQIASHDMNVANGNRAARLVRALQAGTSLKEAIESTPVLASPDVRLALHADADTEQRRKVIRTAITVPRRCSTFMTNPEVWTRGVYVFTVIFIAIVLLTFVNIKVLPTFQTILADFEIQSPFALKSAIRASAWFADVGWAILFLPMVVTALVLTCLPLFPTQADRWKRVFPFAAKEDHAALLRYLSVSADTGESLINTLRQTDRPTLGPYLHVRLGQANRELDRGASVWTALRCAKLIDRQEAKLLETADAVGNLPWVLRQLANRRQPHAGSVWSAVVHLLFPLCIIVLGGMVLWAGVALFSMLTAIIYHLS